MSTRPVKAVAFDVNETLFALDGLRPVFAAVGLDPGLVPLWFARTLRDAFALTAAGGFRPLADIAGDALVDLDPDRLGEPEVSEVLAGMRRLEPHPDVVPAMRKLARAGVPAVTLSNSSAEMVTALLQRAGLADLVAQVVSVDAVRRMKPAPEPYRHAAAVLGIHAGELALVAAHPWDCAGARRVGLRTGWVRRGPAHWPRVFPGPDVTGAGLLDVVESLLVDSE